MFKLQELCGAKLVKITEERHNLRLLPLPNSIKNQLDKNAMQYFDVHLTLSNKLYLHKNPSANIIHPILIKYMFYEYKNHKYCETCWIKYGNVGCWLFSVLYETITYRIDNNNILYCSNCYVLPLFRTAYHEYAPLDNLGIDMSFIAKYPKKYIELRQQAKINAFT
jgi:hypothetical protein